MNLSFEPWTSLLNAPISFLRVTLFSQAHSHELVKDGRATHRKLLPKVIMHEARPSPPHYIIIQKKPMATWARVGKWVNESVL